MLIGTRLRLMIEHSSVLSGCIGNERGKRRDVCIDIKIFHLCPYLLKAIIMCDNNILRSIFKVGVYWLLVLQHCGYFVNGFAYLSHMHIYYLVLSLQIPAPNDTL
jgi:hypothetical protein